MKQSIDYLKQSKFLRLIEQIDQNVDFSTDGQELYGGMLKEHQQEAIKEHGGFLSLVPAEDYPNVIFYLLQQINYFNLSLEGWVFTSLDMKTNEKKAIEKDLRLAKKYYESIQHSPSLELVSLVKQNIEDLEHKLQFQPKVYDDHGNYIIVLDKEYPTIGQHQYEQYSKGDKFTKQDIKEWLERIVRIYNIQGYSKSIKKLTDNL